MRSSVSYPLIHPDWIFLRVLGDSVKKIITDERRLLYVACTREVRTLILLIEGDRPSLFVQETKDHFDMLSWHSYPPLGSDSRWIVKVGNGAGLGSTPTCEVRGELKEQGFSFSASGHSAHWARRFPRR